MTVSFPPELAALARESAKRTGLPLSTYVQQLIRQDVGMPNVFQKKTQPPTQTPNFPAGNSLKSEATP